MISARARYGRVVMGTDREDKIWRQDKYGIVWHDKYKTGRHGKYGIWRQDKYGIVWRDKYKKGRHGKYGIW